MRIFISHSSNDKKPYCDKLVDYLVKNVGKNSVIYDKMTFEAGEKSIDEINRTLGTTDLFVILLSDSALESKWVKEELRNAYNKLNEKTINRIYPIIIDKNIKYSDNRIPKWLKDYNLKYIARPSKTARLIIERAKDVSWRLHSKSLRSREIFVGRNDLINAFEIRNDDFEQAPLNTYIVSGIPKIGRKSLAKYCLTKGSIISSYYDFPQISLDYKESIEDFIIKIHDLGFDSCSRETINSSITKTLEDKINVSISILSEIQNISEIIMIRDDGCIVDFKGELSSWFKEIIRSPNLSESILFIVITRYKTNYETIRSVPSATFSNVPELNTKERKGLLKRLSESANLELNRDEYELICNNLTGYPEQIYYAVDLIINNGFNYLSNNIKLLTEFNEQEVSLLLEKFKDTSKSMEILALIAKYDAISLSMLQDILSETPEYQDVYNKLYQESFFELEGVNKEYIRLNSVIKNYILRSGTKISSKHINKLHIIFQKMFTDEDATWYSANDFLLAIREQVKEGKRVPTQYMIPSVYLKCMFELYDDMKYENVVKLAHIALDNSENMDERIVYEIRYLLCSALAKQKESKCLEEINKINDYNRLFLLSFYYRQIGKNDKALKYLNELLDKNPNMSKAKREKVLVLKNLQQFEEATDLAKENYYLYSDNPYHIQAYFDCLINNYSKNPDGLLLLSLLNKLERIQSEKAQSMYERCLALYEAYVNDEFSIAISTIDQAIENYPKDKKYALITKFDIALHFNNTETMNIVIKELEKEKSASNSIVICKSKLYAAEGNINKAIKFFSNNISYFTEESKNAFCEKLRKSKSI